MSSLAKPVITVEKRFWKSKYNLNITKTFDECRPNTGQFRGGHSPEQYLGAVLIFPCNF